jgi:hypothetical protein
MKETALIIGLDEYDLDLNEIKNFGDRIVKVSVVIGGIPEEEFFKYPIGARKKKVKKWYRDAYKKIISKWPSKIIKKEGSNIRPTGFVSEIKAKDISIVNSIAKIVILSILEIEGLGRTKKKQRKEKKYFSVKARFVEQIEGMTKGLQKCEDRIVLVKAYDFKDAEKRAMKEFKEYEQTYLSSNALTMVRLKFEEVIYIYDVLEEEIDPKGTEVYSEFKYRRMRPEYEWHPKYEIYEELY